MTTSTVIATVEGGGDWGRVTVSFSCCDYMETHSFMIHTFSFSLSSRGSNVRYKRYNRYAI